MKDTEHNIFYMVVAAKSKSGVSTELNVPHDYTGVGMKKGAITFWAETGQ